MTNRQLSVLIALGGVWGASFLFIKVLVDAGVAPIGLSAARTALGFLCLAPFIWRSRRRLPSSRQTWLLIAGLGFLNFAVPWTLFATAARHAPSGGSSIANASQPLWGALFTTWLLKADRIDGVKAAGLLVGFAGVVALMGSDLLHAGSSGSVAILLMLLATLCYGISAVAIRKYLRELPAVVVAGGQVGFASLYLLPFALGTGAYSSATFGAGEWASLLTLGCVGSGLGVVGYMWLIAQVGPIRASVVTYLMPPLGVFLGWAVLDERVGWNLVAGLALVVAGVALVQGGSIPRACRGGVQPLPAAAAD